MIAASPRRTVRPGPDLRTQDGAAADFGASVESGRRIRRGTEQIAHERNDLDMVGDWTSDGNLLLRAPS